MVLSMNAYGGFYPSLRPSIICTNTAPQDNFVTAILSAEHIIELGRLRESL